MDTSPVSFADLGLPEELVSELSHQGITHPFPIQIATISDALSGRDTLGRGRTGSGKTLAFSLPMLARLNDSGRERQRFAPRAVVLVPTRELANQVRDVIAPLAAALDMRVATVYGGVSYNGQINALRNGVDIIVACPGRFIDLMKGGNLDLDAVEITVLDEADHMAELGFLEHVTQILEQTPRNGQRLLFSATLDRGIDKLVRKFLHDPITHEIEEDDEVESAMTHYFFNVTQNDRLAVITDLCSAPGRSLVFTRTKHGARKMAAALVKAGVPTVELHGDLSQAVRARNLAALANGKVDTLVATDIAARGIHVDDIALVIHADPPEEHKAFLHRSGRTARAGAEGTVITMVTENQRRHTKRLAKDADIEPISVKVEPGSEILTEIAPGERTQREMPDLDERRPANRNKGPRNGGPRHRDRDRGPRRFDRDDRAPRSRDDRDDRGPRRFDRDDRAPRSRDDRDDRGPRRFERDDRGPRRFDRDDRAPRSRDDRDDRGPRRFDRDDRSPRSGGRFERDDRAPRGGGRFERDARGGTDTRRDSRGGFEPRREGRGGPAPRRNGRPGESRGQGRPGGAPQGRKRRPG